MAPLISIGTSFLQPSPMVHVCVCLGLFVRERVSKTLASVKNTGTN